jgi:hypothetical protein
MPKPSELILELHSALGTTLEQFDMIDRADLAQTMLNATLQECEAVSTRLQNVKVEIAQAEAALQSKHHLINDKAAKELRDLNREIAEKQAELSSIEQGQMKCTSQQAA